MPTKQRHYAIEFAERYKSSNDPHLNAWTAIFRLNELIEDANALDALFSKEEPKDDLPSLDWVKSEAVSYYAVGFVTCLEWHARSRLADLLTFQPGAVRTADVKILKENVVVEMLAANVTVASIVGAATSVSNLDEYLGVFTRIFEALGSKLSRDSPVDQRIEASLVVQVLHGCMDGAIESGAVGAGLRPVDRVLKSVDEQQNTEKLGHPCNS